MLSTLFFHLLCIFSSAENVRLKEELQMKQAQVDKMVKMHTHLGLVDLAQPHTCTGIHCTGVSMLMYCYTNHIDMIWSCAASWQIGSHDITV